MKHIEITTEPVITKIKDVNRVAFHIFFPMQKKNKFTHETKILLDILFDSTKKYNNTEFSLLSKKLNIMGKSAQYHSVTNCRILEISFILPKEGLIDDFSLDDCLDFYHEIIFNPNVSNGEFNETILNRIKNNISEQLSNSENNFYSKSGSEFVKITDPKEERRASIETRKKALDKVTPKSLYNFYKKIIKDNKYFVFISGALEDEKELVKTFKKHFNEDKCTIAYDREYFPKFDINEFKIVEKEQDFNQTFLGYKYQIKDFNENDFDSYQMLKFMLSAQENNLFFNKLRVHNGLVYSSDCFFDYYLSDIDLFAYLDYKNVDKAKEVIKDLMNEIRDKKVFDECKKRSVKAIKYDMLNDEDNPFSEESNKISPYVKIGISLEETYERTKNLTYERFIEFLDRVVCTNEVVLKGCDKDV